MLAEIQNVASDWGDTASITALVLTIVGFSITIVGVWRSKAAAAQAREAAENAIEVVTKFDILSELTSTLAAIEEVRRLQREHAWRILPDRYADIRRRLTVVTNSDMTIVNEHREAIQSSAKVIDRFQRKVELALANGGEPPNPAKLNIALSIEFDKLHSVLLQIRNQYREER